MLLSNVVFTSDGASLSAALFGADPSIYLHYCAFILLVLLKIPTSLPLFISLTLNLYLSDIESQMGVLAIKAPYEKVALNLPHSSS